MIYRCSNCKGESISHKHPGIFCWACCQPVTFVPVGTVDVSEFAKSWEGLLGKADDELEELTRQWAVESL